MANTISATLSPGKPSKRYARFDFDSGQPVVGSIYVPKAKADGIVGLTVVITLAK